MSVKSSCYTFEYIHRIQFIDIDEKASICGRVTTKRAAAFPFSTFESPSFKVPLLSLRTLLYCVLKVVPLILFWSEIWQKWNPRGGGLRRQRGFRFPREAWNLFEVSCFYSLQMGLRHPEGQRSWNRLSRKFKNLCRLMMKVCIFLKNGNARQKFFPPSLNRIKMHSPISRRRKYYIVTNGPFTPYFYFCGMCSMNREMGPQAHIDFSFLGFSSFTTTVRKREMETTLHLMNPSRVIVTSTVAVSFRKATLLGHNVLTCTTQKVPWSFWLQTHVFQFLLKLFSSPCKRANFRSRSQISDLREFGEKPALRRQAC